MICDPNLEVITDELISKRGCHTVILYGSRARGEETATSDYDVLGIRESGDVFRDARPWRGSYLDIFVWPESKVVNPDETLVYLRQGVVLHEKGDIGTRFLARLAEIHKAGPKKLSTDEISARKLVRSWRAPALETDPSGFRKSLAHLRPEAEE
jgi:predicted nucleotidyltransferase